MRAIVPRKRKQARRRDLEALMQKIEGAHASALSGNLGFLAYLLDMARLEAAAVLEASERRISREDSPTSSGNVREEEPA